MDKKDLLDVMEFYMFDDIVKKRTSIKGNTYFYVKDNSVEDGEMYVVYAYYTENDKTLHLFPYWFTENDKIKTFPTYKGGNLYATINGEPVLDLVYEWFQNKFPELDIRRMEEMLDYMFDIEVKNIEKIDEHFVNIHSNISEDIKRIKRLL
jgi:hypothetical protein